MPKHIFLEKSSFDDTSQGREKKKTFCNKMKKIYSFRRSLPRASREELNASYLEDSAPLTSRRKLGDCPLLLLASTSRLLCFPSSIWVKIFLFWFRDCSKILIFLSIPRSLPLLCSCKPSHAERESERASNETQTHTLQASSLQP